MNLNALKDIPPWDWPEDTARGLLGILRDEHALESDRILAAELAGDFTVINDDLVDALLFLLKKSDASERLRGRAAISLGPILEHVDTEEFVDSEEVPISEDTFHKIQKSLFQLYMGANPPMEVRRRILEASVRAPQDWHPGAVRAAYGIDDELWKLTAVFCMRFVPGFDEPILEALNSKNEDIHQEAVLAAGNWGLDGAWLHVVNLVTSEDTDKRMRLAAIDAVASIRPHKAEEILRDLTDSSDEDIVNAAYEAIAMAEGSSAEDEEEEDKEDNDLLNSLF